MSGCHLQRLVREILYLSDLCKVLFNSRSAIETVLWGLREFSFIFLPFGFWGASFQTMAPLASEIKAEMARLPLKQADRVIYFGSGGREGG